MGGEDEQGSDDGVANDDQRLEQEGTRSSEMAPECHEDVPAEEPPQLQDLTWFAKLPEVTQPPARSDRVSQRDLLSFVFSKALQHPQSTGRLIAFGLYGPLDENGQLRSGIKVLGTIRSCLPLGAYKG